MTVNVDSRRIHDNIQNLTFSTKEPRTKQFCTIECTMVTMAAACVLIHCSTALDNQTFFTKTTSRRTRWRDPFDNKSETHDIVQNTDAPVDHCPKASQDYFICVLLLTLLLSAALYYWIFSLLDLHQLWVLSVAIEFFIQATADT